LRSTIITTWLALLGGVEKYPPEVIVAATVCSDTSRQ
jgi:hypothetical protein